MLAAPYAYGGLGYGGYAPGFGYGYGVGPYGGLGWFDQQHGQQHHPGMTNLMMQPGMELQQDFHLPSWKQVKDAAEKGLSGIADEIKADIKTQDAKTLDPF